MSLQNSSEEPPRDLTAEDYEKALDRLKQDLALLRLKRLLLQPGLSAREVLQTTQEICRLQTARDLDPT